MEEDTKTKVLYKQVNKWVPAFAGMTSPKCIWGYLLAIYNY
jgi:hypothetical protein